MENLGYILAAVIILLQVYATFFKKGNANGPTDAALSNELAAAKATADQLKQQIQRLEADNGHNTQKLLDLQSVVGNKESEIFNLTQKVSSQETRAKEELDAALNNARELHQQKLKLEEEKVTQLEKNLAEQKDEASRKVLEAVSNQKELAEQSIAAKNHEIATLKENLERERNNLAETKKAMSEKQAEDMRAMRADFAEQLENARKDREVLAEQMKTMKEEVTNVLKLAADENIKNSSEGFLAMAKEKLEATVLAPISEFRKRVEEQIQLSTENKATFETHIKALNESTLKIQADANELTQAIKGKSKVQGDWGEVQLYTLLENSGLKKGVNYFVQETAMSEDGSFLRPDVKVTLPGDKHIIIDSKVSIKRYIDAVNAEDKITEDKALKDHVESIKGHIKGLSSKNYQSTNINNAEYVLMFIPVETAFLSACNFDPSLWSFAYDKKIIMVSPSTLLATLFTVNSVWNQDSRIKNIEQISTFGNRIYNSLVSFEKSFEKISTNFERASTSFQEAYKSIRGERGAMHYAEEMRKLGLNTNKRLKSASKSNDASISDESNGDESEE